MAGKGHFQLHLLFSVAKLINKSESAKNLSQNPQKLKFHGQARTDFLFAGAKAGDID